MQSEHETIATDRKLELLLLVLCQIVCFLAVLVLLGWGLSSI